MTQLDYIFIVEGFFQVQEVSIRIDRAVIRQALQESRQMLYPVMVAADDTFWRRSLAFASAADVNFPPNYGMTILIEVPTAAEGAAKQISHREWQTVMNNSVEAATADQPLFRLDGTSFHIAPNVAGVHYFIATTGEVTDDTQEMTAFGGATPAIIPWAFEEAYVMGALHILAQREAGRPGIPQSDVAKLFEMTEQTKAAFDNAKSIESVFRQTTMIPKLPSPPPQQ